MTRFGARDGLGAVTARAAVAIIAVSALTSAFAAEGAGSIDFSGQLRPQWIEQTVNARGPLAAANALVPGTAAAPVSGPALETELRASGRGLSATVTLRQRHVEGVGTRSKAWVNELYGSAGGASWQFSAGKKIVAWDVGYGFRPNDVVEQEVRRTLLAVTPEGRPVLTAEHFDATTAWAFVLVNPTKPRGARGADEPALAARVYRRDGAVDWHGFARLGARTGASLGGAVAWVASESIELHASVRAIARADTLASALGDGAGNATLVRENPWLAATARHTAQALVGGTWTNNAQISVLAEAWWDGTALSDRQWDAWNARNDALRSIAAGPIPAAALAGNLAWQASAFGASNNLRRANLYSRLSWTYEKWQPAIDLLLTPADRGHVVTASLGWQGDRLRVDGGLRLYGGPGDAVLAQVPAKRVLYLAGTWAF